jgi:hypothetical protein
MTEPRDEPDIEIGAFAKAKKLRFHRKPETDVEFHGEPEIESFSGDVRDNLPDEVEPGKTYRDVKIGWRAAARFRPPEEADEES